MARTKKFNLVVKATNKKGEVYFINDLGEAKSPRFELYDKSLKEAIKKSDNPTDFDKYIFGKDKNDE